MRIGNMKLSIYAFSLALLTAAHVVNASSCHAVSMICSTIHDKDTCHAAFQYYKNKRQNCKWDPSIAFGVCKKDGKTCGPSACHAVSLICSTIGDNEKVCKSAYQYDNGTSHNCEYVTKKSGEAQWNECVQGKSCSLALMYEEDQFMNESSEEL